MLQPPVEVRVRWTRSVGDEELRARIEAELHPIAWTLSQMEALMHDAHRVTSFDHAFLMPRLALRLPLYDLGRRFRVELTHVADKPRISLLDEENDRVADIIVCG